MSLRCVDLPTIPPFHLNIKIDYIIVPSLDSYYVLQKYNQLDNKRIQKQVMASDLSYTKLSKREVTSKIKEMNSEITELNLGENSDLFDCDCVVRALTKMLRKNNTLKKLILYDDGLHSKAVSSIFKALTKNQGLEELDLTLNHIGGAGVEALLRMLQQNTTLQKLSLCENDLTDQDLEALSVGLNENKFLTNLDLSFNTFSVGVLCQLFKSNHTLTDVTISLASSMFTSSADLNRLRAVLIQNNTVSVIRIESFDIHPFLKDKDELVTWMEETEKLVNLERLSKISRDVQVDHFLLEKVLNQFTMAVVK